MTIGVKTLTLGFRVNLGSISGQSTSMVGITAISFCLMKIPLEFLTINARKRIIQGFSGPLATVGHFLGGPF